MAERDSLLTTYWSGSTSSCLRCFWWTGLAPWEFEFPFPGSLISTFLGGRSRIHCSGPRTRPPSGVYTRTTRGLHSKRRDLRSETLAGIGPPRLELEPLAGARPRPDARTRDPGGAFSYERGTPVESGRPELASGGLRWGETNARFLGETEQSAPPTRVMAPTSAEAGLSPESPSRRWRLAVLRSPIAGSRSPLSSRSSTSPLVGPMPYVPRPLPPN